MYEQHCAMHILHDCFINVCRPRPLCRSTICVVPVLATVESNFNTFQLKTNENYDSTHSHLIHSFSGQTLAEFERGFEYVVLCCHSLYSIVYHVLGHSLSLNVTLFTILLPHNVFLSCIKAANATKYIHELPMFAYNL